MKYFFLLFIAISLAGCLKEDENGCPLYVNVPAPYSPLVFEIIDADSTNLLENGTIDTTQIIIEDAEGNNQKFSVFRDSTYTKTRFISVPLLEKVGTNELKITVNNKEAFLKYNYTYVEEPCGDYSYHDKYVLNGMPYQLHGKNTYFMHLNEKIPAVFRVIYLSY